MLIPAIADDLTTVVSSCSGWLMVGHRGTAARARHTGAVAIELTDDEFDLLYRSLRATVEQTTHDETLDVVELEDQAWQVMQEIAHRSGYPLASEPSS